MPKHTVVAIVPTGLVAAAVAADTAVLLATGHRTVSVRDRVRAVVLAHRGGLV